MFSNCNNIRFFFYILLPNANVTCFLNVGTNLGHYVSNIWNEKERLWLHCDDDLVKEIREQEVLSVSSRDAYLLFYAAMWVQNWFSPSVCFCMCSYRKQHAGLFLDWMIFPLNELLLFSTVIGFPLFIRILMQNFFSLSDNRLIQVDGRRWRTRKTDFAVDVLPFDSFIFLASTCVPFQRTFCLRWSECPFFNWQQPCLLVFF